MKKRVKTLYPGYGIDTRRYIRKEACVLYAPGSTGFVARELDDRTHIVELDNGLTTVMSPNAYEEIV